jgi:protease I
MSMSRVDAHAGVFLLEGFQEMEFWYPVLRFREEGIRVTVIGRDTERTTFSRLGYPVVAEASLSAVPADCSVLMVPGAHGAPDPATAAQIVAALQLAHKRAATVAAVGNSVRLLGDAGLLRGVRVAAPAEIAASLIAQGAVLAGLAVCVDHGVVTARGVDDLPEFFRALNATIQ